MDVISLPHGPMFQEICDEDAIFFANMETAIALCQDAAPVLGERVAIFGAGVVGALTAALLSPRFEVRISRDEASSQWIQTMNTYEPTRETIQNAKKLGKKHLRYNVMTVMRFKIVKSGANQQRGQCRPSHILTFWCMFDGKSSRLRLLSIPYSMF